MVAIDLTFPHGYELERVPELPSTGSPRIEAKFIPAPSSRVEHDGVWVHVVPKGGNQWTGVFAFGGEYSFSRIVSTPSPETVCVIAQGVAYLIPVADPLKWHKLDLHPVTGVYPILEARLLIFESFSRLLALGPLGLAWVSDYLGCDHLRVLRADSRQIDCTGYDPLSDAHDLRLSLETATGRVLQE